MNTTKLTQMAVDYLKETDETERKLLADEIVFEILNKE